MLTFDIYDADARYRKSTNEIRLALQHNGGGLMAEKEYVVTITEILRRKVSVKVKNMIEHSARSKQTIRT